MLVLALATDRKCSSASREACQGTDRRGLDPRPTGVPHTGAPRSCRVVPFVYLASFEDGTSQERKLLI
jgi:hypothetical protein